MFLAGGCCPDLCGLETFLFQWCWGLIVNCYSVDGFEASLYMDICEIHRVSCGKS